MMASLIPEKKTRGLALPEPQAATDPVMRAETANQRARLQLAAYGAEDPTKKKGPSALEKIFGVLDTPGTAVRTTLYNTFNSPEDKDLSITKEVGKAFRGEDRLTGSDILDEMGVENKWGQLIGGFLFDVVTDPVTYLTLGVGGATKAAGASLVDDLVKAGGKVATLGGKYGDEVVRSLLPYADDAGNIAVDALGKEGSRDFMQTVFRSLGDKGGIKLGGKTIAPVQGTLARGAYGAKDALRAVPGSEWFEKAFLKGELAPLYREGNEAVNAATNVIRRDLSGKLALGDHLASGFTNRLKEMLPDEAARMDVTLAIGRQMKDPENLKVIEQSLRNSGLDGKQLDDAMGMAGVFREKMVELLDTQKKAGVDLADLGESYIPGVAKFARDKKGSQAYDEALKARGFSVDELLDPAKPTQTSWRKSLIPDAPKSKTRLTPEDRLTGVTREGDEAAKISTELDAALLGGYATSKAAKNVALAEYQADLTRLLGDNELAKALLSKTEAAFTNDEATKGFLKVYDNVLGDWKMLATSMNFPQFPARNLLSNKWLQWTEGLLNPLAEKQAGGLLKNMASGTLSESDEALVREMVENRIFTSIREMAEITGQKNVTGIHRLIRENPLAKFGSSLNEFAENQSRASAYLAAKAKGLDPKAAREMVDKALYSYDPASLTLFERNFMRRVAPFYVWMRRNTPHMVELVAKSPGKLTPVGHLRDNARSVTPVDESVMPDWLKDTFPIPLPGGGSSPTMLSTSGVVPVGDLEKLNLIRDGKVDVRDILGSMSPLIKTPLELAFNRDVYFGEDISNFPGDSRRAPAYVERFDDLVSSAAPEALKQAWQMFKDAFDIIEKPSAQGDSYLAMNAYAVKAIKDASPWMNNVAKLMDDQPRTPSDRLTYLTGVRSIKFDEENFRRQKTFDDQAALLDAVARLKAEGIIPKGRQDQKKKPSLIPVRR
jgi:hypothetical protein